MQCYIVWSVTLCDAVLHHVMECYTDAVLHCVMQCYTDAVLHCVMQCYIV